MAADPPRILVAEDDAALRELYTHRLQAIGEYVVLTAESGDDAWAAFDDDVDLAILDEQMPGRSGVELARAIAASPFDVPCVVLSGQDPPEQGSWDAFLRKPVHLDDLRTVLEAHLE
jgi:CheY-like chemotaxis protein